MSDQFEENHCMFQCTNPECKHKIYKSSAPDLTIEETCTECGNDKFKFRPQLYGAPVGKQDSHRSSYESSNTYKAMKKDGGWNEVMTKMKENHPYMKWKE